MTKRKCKMKFLSIDSSWRRVFVWLPAIAGLLTGVCAGCKPKLPPPGPTEVLVVRVVQKDVPLYREWVGSTDGVTNAVIHAHVTGYLLSLDYEEGRQVKKGDR